MSKSKHADRLEEGFAGLVVLAIVGSILYAAKIALFMWAIPHSELVIWLAIRIVGLFVGAYVLGYLSTDFLDDVREVLD